MTLEEIDLMFPPTYSGNAQISDLRRFLTHLLESGELKGIDFYEVNDLTERDAINASCCDICKVDDINGLGYSETYIYTEGNWVVMHSVSSGGGPSLSKTTENFTVTAVQESNQNIQLQHIPNAGDHLFVFLNGMYLMLGNNYDYTLSGNTLVFNNILTSGDNLAVKYSY